MKAQKGYLYFDEHRNRWVARYQPIIDGKQINLKRYADSKREAGEKLRKLIEQYDTEGIHAISAEKLTFAELVTEYERHRVIQAQYIGEKKIAGMRNTASAKFFLISLTAHFGDRLVRSITHSDIEAYKLALLKRPTRTGEQRTVATINRELEFLRAVLNYAVTNGKLTKNPFNLGKGRKLIDKAAETRREKFPGFGEEMALLATCTGRRSHLRAVLICAADTGLRRNELFTLEISDLDFVKKIISVRAINAKTNRARQIPMTTRVWQELLQLCENRKEGLVFGGLAEVKKSFASACMATKIEDLHFHDFRHAFVSRSILAGVPPAIALKASGHASDEWKRYLNVTPEQMQRLFLPLEGQNAEEVKAYGVQILKQLRDALGYTDLAQLIASLGSP